MRKIKIRKGNYMITDEVYNNLEWRELHTVREIKDVLVGSVVEDVEEFGADYVDAEGKGIFSGTLLYVRQSFGVKGVIQMYADSSEDEYQNFYVTYAELPA